MRGRLNRFLEVPCKTYDLRSSREGVNCQSKLGPHLEMQKRSVSGDGSREEQERMISVPFILEQTW
jgi:hypothetical protein